MIDSGLISPEGPGNGEIRISIFQELDFDLPYFQDPDSELDIRYFNNSFSFDSEPLE